jgi:hypothetical protein
MRLKSIYKPIRAIGSDPVLTLAIIKAISQPKKQTGWLNILKNIAKRNGVSL